jgi:hypothetical protein
MEESMSHHSPKPWPEGRVVPMGTCEDLAEELGLGPTRSFPGGKITREDEGEITIAAGVHEGKVILNFGIPIAWIGFDADQARRIAAVLLERARQIDGK